MKRLLTLVLLIALCMTACAGAMAERAAYSSTQAFLDALEQTGQECVLDGVDEYGAECVLIKNTGEPFLYEMVVMFEEDLEHASIRVWYIIEYDGARLAEVVQVCNALNAGNRFVSFYADESDDTVTASMDLIFRDDDAGAVTLKAVRRLTDALHRAYPQLLACTGPAATPAPASAAPRAAAAPTPDVAGRTVVITADSARLRAAPNTSGSYVATVYGGDSFTCLGAANGWYAIDYHGRRAYVSADKAGLE